MPGPAGSSLFIPTGPTPDFEAILQNDPWWKQQNEWITEQQRLATEGLNRDRTFFDRDYDINLTAAQQSYDPNYDYGLGNAEAQAALAKQKAARENANRAEYLNEWLTSRGLRDSGQQGLEQGEREFDFNMYNQGLDLGLAGQRTEAQRSRTSAQNALATRLAELQLGRDKTLTGFDVEQAGIPGTYARQRGQARFDAFDRLSASGALKQPGINAIWDEESQLYVTADGKYYTASGDPTSWNKPIAAPAPYSSPAYAGAAPAPSAGAAQISPEIAALAGVAPGPITSYPESRPEENYGSPLPYGGTPGWGYA